MSWSPLPSLTGLPRMALSSSLLKNWQAGLVPAGPPAAPPLVPPEPVVPPPPPPHAAASEQTTTITKGAALRVNLVLVNLVMGIVAVSLGCRRQRSEGRRKTRVGVRPRPRRRRRRFVAGGQRPSGPGVRPTPAPRW